MSAPISGDVILAVQKSALKEVKTAIKTIAPVHSRWCEWVKMRRTQREQISSGVPHYADLDEACRHFSDGPIRDITIQRRKLEQRSIFGSTGPSDAASKERLRRQFAETRLIIPCKSSKVGKANGICDRSY
jgi:hypothetical protein